MSLAFSSTRLAAATAGSVGGYQQHGSVLGAKEGAVKMKGHCPECFNRRGGDDDDAEELKEAVPIGYV